MAWNKSPQFSAQNIAIINFDDTYQPGGSVSDKLGVNIIVINWAFSF